MCKRCIRVSKTVVLQRAWRQVALLLCLAAGAPAWGLGGDFTLTADDGSRYSLSDSRGKVVVLSFGYTYCPDVCPTALATITMALKQLGDASAQVDPLFISLDPERDTPAVLREYTRFFHPRLRGLTGDPAQLKEIADRYRVRFAFVGKGDTDRYTLDHGASLYIIDARGQLFRMLPHGLPPRALENSLRAALEATSPQTVQSPTPGTAP
jgi:protein SCO1/2